MRPVILFLAAAILVGFAPTAQDGRAHQTGRNLRGIHTLAASRKAMDDQLAWAEALVGPGGHVTQPILGLGAGTAGPSDDAIYYVEQAYRRRLDPILVLQSRYVNRDGCNATGYVGWLPPSPDAGGTSYQAEAEAYARVVAGLPRQDGRLLYVQIGNEPNLNEMWGGAASPAEYARFFVQVSAAIRAIGDPRIVVLNAALAPEGDIDNLEFLRQALAAEPAFATSFDLWASHPYPRNQPPAQNLHDGTALPGSRYAIDAYLLELDVLAEYGLNTDALQVVLTETGYELGDAHYAQYPPITDELRAAYAAVAFERYWPRWPEIRAVTPFQLSGWYGTWRTFEWVHPSSTTNAQGLPTQPRLQYARLLPGVRVLTGVVVDDRGAPVDGAQIVGEPGGYAATSLPDGTFVLLAQSGVTTIRAEKDGYDSSVNAFIESVAGARRSVRLVMPAQLPVTLRNASFEDMDLTGWTKWGSVDGVQTSPWFFDLAALDGTAFLGTAVNCGEKDGGVYQTVSTT
ncbi:MAG: carboxypeptidase-like regulatory domain-containing protein, partial [Chloroflexota bacterium]